MITYTRLTSLNSRLAKYVNYLDLNFQQDPWIFKNLKINHFHSLPNFSTLRFWLSINDMKKSKKAELRR